MKMKYKIIIVSILVIIITWGIVRKVQHSKNRPIWRTDTVTVGNIREEVTATGTINPVTLVSVGTEISGKIIKIYKDFNQTVHKGEILARLDTDNLETSLATAKTEVAKAQTSLQSAQLDLDIIQKLSKKDMASTYELQKAQFTYDQAKQSVDNAKANLKKAQKNLDNAIITSPIDGIIISRAVDEGQTVAASLNAPTLFTIANDLTVMQIDADVDEADIGKIKLGLKVEFTVDAYPSESFEGEVQQVRLNSKTEQNVVSYSVIVRLHNPDLKLLPGMTANVTIIVNEKNGVMRIPESALRFKATKEVWKQFGLKLDDESLRKRFSSNQGHNKMQFSSGSATSAPQKYSGNYKRPSIPDSIRAKLASLPEEQRRAAYRKYMSKHTSQEPSNQANQSTANLFSGGLTNTEPGIARIWVLENGKPKSIRIETGLSDGNYIEVLSGLKQNQQVITGVTQKKLSTNNSSSGMPFGGGMGPVPGGRR